MNETIIKDCLHNLSIHENNNMKATDEQKKYYHGLIVGLVSALIADGKSYYQAVVIVRNNLPWEYMNDFIPLAYREDVVR